MRDRLIEAGFPPDRVIACNPVIDVQRFRNRADNGPALMNAGAAIPKKNMAEYVELSRLVPDRAFNLYALGYLSRELAQLNAASGGRVKFIPPVDPEDMPPEYKQHAWLVYTAAHSDNTVGWPMSLIEAMASGVGVCMQDIRPDLRQFLGDAGYLFDHTNELAARLRIDPTAAERERAFQWAEQYDFRKDLPLLTNLWD